MANVSIYSTPVCPWCKRAKQFLSEHKVPYTELDVASNITNRNDMVRKSGQLGVPVIDIDGEIIIGFDEPRLKKKLNIQ